jgi:hypothetical protein
MGHKFLLQPRKTMQTTFADAILNIAVTGPLIRIDLGVMAPQVDAQGKQTVRAVHTQQIVMPMEGFVRAVGTQEQVIKKLLDDGIIQAKPKSGSGETVNTKDAKAGDKSGKAKR